MSKWAPKSPHVLRTVPCPQCGENVNLSAEILKGYYSEKRAAWHFCPRCQPKEAVEAKQRQEETRITLAKWEEERKAFLGHDCPPFQAKLFWCLKGEDQLSEDEVCEILYGVPSRHTTGIGKTPGWFQLTDRERKRFGDRLRRLQKEVNDRLKKRKIAFQIVRPEAGHLQLKALGPAPKREPKPGPERQADSARLQELLAKAGPYMPKPSSPARDWVYFLKNELRSGKWVASVELQEKATEMGCTPAKYRKALSLMPVEKACKRVGGLNRWYVRLTERAS